MKKKLLFITIILTTIFSYTSYSQNKEIKKVDPSQFDEQAAYEQAKTKGVPASDIKGYIQSLRSDFASRKALEKEPHKHTPYENAEHVNERVIYLNGDNKPMSIGCPNAGFENYDFTGWSGSTGTYSGTAASPVYALTPGIVNTAGNNTPLGNTINYQTILSIPATNPAYPNCMGYDSMACPSGGPLISQIPFVSPYSLDGVSCRMLGAFSNYKVAKLKYIMSVTPTNKLFSYSYAVVLNDGHTGQPATHQPYFNVTVKDQNGNPIASCQPYTVDATIAATDTSYRLSHLTYGGNPVVYRPWRLVSIDLSSPIYSAVTSISVEFEVAGCTAGGHLGYAYVDAECGAGGVSSAFCGGTSAVLTAPLGYTNYQWYNSSGIPIAPPAGTSPTLSISSPVAGSTYSVSMSTPGGCSVTLTQTISPTNVSIQNINSAPSCAGGNSGVATVVPAGSTGIYTYTWTSISTGNVVSNSQTATGLAPGNYSVLVSSPSCGQASANLSVGVSPPFFIAQTKNFCGNATIIPQPGGSNYVWYKNAVLIPAPAGTNDSLYINNALNNDIYTVVYNNSQGCRDSIKYTLKSITGGYSYFSNTNNVCPGNSNGSSQLILSTPFAAPYSFLVTGPTSSSVVASTTGSTTTLSLTSLSPGTYTAVVNDGVCIYNNTLTINVIATDFTITPTNTVLCYPQAVTANFNFGETAPTVCGLSSTGGCVSPNSTQIGFGTSVNSTTSYPAIYGNWYRNTRHQILYKASELIAAGITAGKISSISFNITTINGITSYPDFSIKLKCTNDQDLSSTAFDQVGLSQVFYAPSININTGWNTYTFGTPYEWDGVSNLLIDVCNSQTPITATYPNGYSQNSSNTYTTTPFASVRWYSSDPNVACPTATATTYAPNNTYRPNIKFGYCGASNPTSYTVAVSSNGTITANYANDSLRVAPTSPPSGNGIVVYTFSVTNPVGSCIATQTLAVLYPPLTTSITAAVTNTTLCEGDNTLLSANGAFNYNWYYQQGSTQIPISTSDTITVVPPAIGTNTYIVTGYAPCASSTPDTKTITVTVTPKTTLFTTPLQDVTKCMNKSFVLTTGVGSSIPSNSGAPYTYSWTTLPSNTPAPGATNSSSYTANNNNATTYVVTVNGVCAYPTSDTIVVSNFVDDLGVVINDTSSACAGTPFTLNALASGGYPNYFYEWKFLPSYNVISNSSSLNFISPDSEGNYTFQVVVTDSCGYTRNDIQVINVLPPCSVVIPNIITPNSDGVNDFFKIKNIEHHPNTSVTIFDRWGIKVYENPNYNNEWNGSGIADGTYFYVIDIPDDKKYSGFITVFKGK